MVNVVSDIGAIKRLRGISSFVDFACEKMASDPDFWRREAEFGGGIMKAAAAAVVEIGGNPK